MPAHQSELTVIVKAKDLASYVITVTDKSPKRFRFTLVYLDGDYIRNSDVANSEDGISNTGKLNLQFASSATLVPMENTDLFNGTTAPTT